MDVIEDDAGTRQGGQEILPGLMAGIERGKVGRHGLGILVRKEADDD